VPSDPPEAKKTPEPSQSHAFIWRRKYKENKKYEEATATVTSAGLESLIKVTCRPSYWTNYTEFSGNFQTIIWNWDALEEAAAKGDDEATEEEKTGRSDLRLFLGQIKADPTLQPYFQKRVEWERSGEIEFEWLWTLFPQGETIYSCQCFDEPQAFIIRECWTEKYGPEDGRKKDRFFVNCWSYDWNGEKFSRVPATLKIEEYNNAKPIKTLTFYPAKYHIDENGDRSDRTLRERLIRRGKRFKKICCAQKGSQMFHCEGLVLLHAKYGGNLLNHNSHVCILTLDFTAH
jgi:hypothetical protein